VEKQSFILYKSFYKPTKGLTLEQKGMLYDAIFQYQIDGTEPNISCDIIMAFMFFKNQFDLDISKWDAVLEKRREAGKLGGIAKASKSKQKVANVASAKSAKQTWQDLANVPDNDNENVNDTVNENVNVNEKEKEKTGEKKFSLLEKLTDDWHNRFLEVVGIKYDWNAIEIKTLKQLIEKFKRIVKDKNKKTKYAANMDAQVIETWTYFMDKLPKWYQERPDLKIINSKFNAIIGQIKNGHGGGQNLSSEFEKLVNLRKQES
tara:strand:- start:779 stop:1564 length:786 start_codon:yes stop_codon:yes gene_type:complete